MQLWLVGELSLTGLQFERALLAAGLLTLLLLAANIFYVKSTGRQREEIHQRSWLSRLVYLIFLAVIIVLALTSFGSILQVGHMEGYALLAHIGAAGAFVFLLLAVAVLYLPLGARPGDRSYTSDDGWWLARWSAWTLVVSALITAGTMFLSMLPVLDTKGLIEVAALHRYAGLVVVVAAIFHAYALLCTRLKLR
jgi:hypothetical protein